MRHALSSRFHGYYGIFCHCPSMFSFKSTQQTRWHRGVVQVLLATKRSVWPECKTSWNLWLSAGNDPFLLDLDEEIHDPLRLRQIQTLQMHPDAEYAWIWQVNVYRSNDSMMKPGTMSALVPWAPGIRSLPLVCCLLSCSRWCRWCWWASVLASMKGYWYPQSMAIFIRKLMINQDKTW